MEAQPFPFHVLFVFFPNEPCCFFLFPGILSALSAESALSRIFLLVPIEGRTPFPEEQADDS